jgi:hypothetical protein
VYIRALHGAGEHIPVSVGGGSEPVWNRSGRELFYRARATQGAELVAATIEYSPELTVSRRTPLFSIAATAEGTPHANYDVHPNGQTFAMVGFNPASRIEVIQNLPGLIAKLRGGR